MFDNINNIRLFSYEVKLDDIVKAICDISFDIGKQIEQIIDLKANQRGFTIEDLFKEDFISEISIRPESLSDQIVEEGKVIKGLTNDDFFSFIADYFNKTLFYMPSFLESLKGSDIIFINKKETCFLSNGDIAKDRLIPALKNAKILKQLIINLKSDKIQGSLQKIDMFENDFFYRNTISTSKQESQPLLPFLHISFINHDLIEITTIDKYDFWINFDYYKKKGIDLSDIDDYSIVLDKENHTEIGLLLNESLILYSNINLITYIIKDKIHDYYWLLLNHTYSQNRPNITSKKDENLEVFKSLNNDIELNQLLSFLKNNFYLSDARKINTKFSNFFNTVVLFDKLKFLEEYQFLMSSNIDEETALGIYSNEKKESSYNLLHWLSHKDAIKVDHFRNSNPTEKEKNLIYTLKPAISYYFLEKYFEDFCKNIFDANNYDFFSNKSFLEKGQAIYEIDFFVNAQNKFYYIETKTKLSKFYIDDFLKKSSKMIEKFNSMIENDIEINFILLGAYSDENVKDYQYFIDANADNKEIGYNIERSGLNCKPYYFNVPIPDKEGRQIICIAEPEYDKLQNLVLRICQK